MASWFTRLSHRQPPAQQLGPPWAVPEQALFDDDEGGSDLPVSQPVPDTPADPENNGSEPPPPPAQRVSVRLYTLRKSVYKQHSFIVEWIMLL